MNLADNRLTEEDIITHCDKSNAEEIINYIFRDLGSSDHGITDEVRLKNFRILLNSEQFQEQLEKENMAAVHNRRLLKLRRLNVIATPNLLPQLALDSLQAALAEMTKTGEMHLLRELLQSYPWELSQVNVPHKAIFIAAGKGDSFTVDLILRRVRGKLPLPVWFDMSDYDKYIQNALIGSVSAGDFEIFKRIISLSNPIGRMVQLFPPLIARDLLNKNLRSWLHYAISNGNYIFNRKNVLHFYVKRSNLKDGNPIKPSPENVQFLMHLPDDNQITMKSFILTMRYAYFDFQEHLARLFMDPLLAFQVKDFTIVGRKRRLQDKLIFELEALNHAIDMIHGYRSESYDHVIAALEKVKREFDLNQKLNPEVYYK
jgi:hypothetical protein